jgi:hypothetical protein
MGGTGRVRTMTLVYALAGIAAVLVIVYAIIVTYWEMR